LILPHSLVFSLSLFSLLPLCDLSHTSLVLEDLSSFWNFTLHLHSHRFHSLRLFSFCTSGLLCSLGFSGYSPLDFWMHSCLSHCTGSCHTALSWRGSLTHCLLTGFRFHHLSLCRFSLTLSLFSLGSYCSLFLPGCCTAPALAFALLSCLVLACCVFLLDGILSCHFHRKGTQPAGDLHSSCLLGYRNCVTWNFVLHCCCTDFFFFLLCSLLLCLFWNIFSHMFSAA